MRTLGVLCLCFALVFSGCDASVSSGMANDFGNDMETAMIAAFVVCVFGGAAAYILMHDVHNRHHFTAGLNYRAPDRTKVDKVFEVKLAVADRKRRQMKTWWTDTVPAIEITPVDGGEAAQFVSSEIKKEWYIARYRAARPGLYHLTVKATIPGESTDAPMREAEVARDIVVR